MGFLKNSACPTLCTGFVEAVNPALAGMSKPAQAAASIVVGGTSSILAGGKFANGAVTASFQLAFNHWYSINNGAVKNVLPQKDRTAISLELSGSICGPVGGFSGGTGIGLSIPDKFWKISEYQVFGSVQASLGIGSIFYLGIGLSPSFERNAGPISSEIGETGVIHEFNIGIDGISGGYNVSTKAPLGVFNPET